MIQQADIHNLCRLCHTFVNSSSARLGRMLPDGWLWQRTIPVAQTEMAFFSIKRISAAVSDIPPWLILCLSTI